MRLRRKTGKHLERFGEVHAGRTSHGSSIFRLLLHGKDIVIVILGIVAGAVTDAIPLKHVDVLLCLLRCKNL